MKKSKTRFNAFSTRRLKKLLNETLEINNAQWDIVKDLGDADYFVTRALEVLRNSRLDSQILLAMKLLLLARADYAALQTETN